MNWVSIGSDNDLSPSAPSHYLDQCWVIINWTLGNKLQWNFHQNTTLFINENALKNIACKMAAILSGADEFERHHRDWYTWVEIDKTNASLRLYLNINTCATKVPSRSNAAKLQVGGWVKVWINILLWVTWFVLTCLVLLTFFSYVVGSRSAPKTNIMLCILRCTLIQQSLRLLPRNHGSHMTAGDFPVRTTKMQSGDVPLRELYYLQQGPWG